MPPVAVHFDPDGQVSQVICPLEEYSPLAQAIGGSDFVGHLYPAGQIVQDVALALLYSPELHAVGAILKKNRVTTVQSL